MIELFDFQRQAVATIIARFAAYWQNRPGRVLGARQTFFPFYQALASITASGKTVIIASAVTELAPLLPVKPLVIWLSKGRVVVAQTYANLQDGGKYRHLLSDFEIRLLPEFSSLEVADPERSFVYFATVGTFNQKDKEKSALLLFQSDLDTADVSIWHALKERATAEALRRPLIIVYDEAHNLTDQQTGLLLELEPDALLLATATPRIPTAIHRILENLKDALGWQDEDFVTDVASRAVVESGLVKRQLIMGGYEAAMETVLDDLLDDMAEADAAVTQLGLSLSPKAIYVCRTNIVEGNAFQRDDPRRPFAQRQAPPILIWRYLVEEKNIDPRAVAVYTSALKFDKDFPAPSDFVQFKGGDADYDTFVSGPFRHIIFNLGLQEGWDDPECYFAYIDKSMASSIQVEQVIGRVLRQPEAAHYEREALNTARFYVRVDQRGVFAEVVDQVRNKLSSENPDIEFTAYEGSGRKRPEPRKPKQRRQVPAVYRDPTEARDPIQAVIDKMTDYRFDSGVNVTGHGARAQVQQTVGAKEDSKVTWVETEHNNAVSARWVFQTAVRRQFPLALEVTPSDDAKFDARIELGSPADHHIRQIADEVVKLYLDRVLLKQRLQNPYVVGDILVDPSTAIKYKKSLHEAYSGLNKLERSFAAELDTRRYIWCRNPSQSGFGIPLLTPGRSRTFFPDFLVWKGSTVLAIDTTGEHILEEKLGRKLLAIQAHPKSKRSLSVRLVSSGSWNDQPQRISGEGFTVWSLGYANALRPVLCKSLLEAVYVCLYDSD